MVMLALMARFGAAESPRGRAGRQGRTSSAPSAASSAPAAEAKREPPVALCSKL
eukprot:CAMPEP_0204051610 /NCGR_PEP_ID=MMETSP0360-20130528/122730_1 /ASSEMBLY_ACC=CAM_ASM_000342 /TAXON_ID=268821 /ORGANISM="Scrippsiella Hangoei, Strain SHTV-5" /LENGTH=53 /DNA_ID=CAMNT_0050998641 /DNA_START=54 /DNA_END=212 /DNA_ORIENTATION=-